VKLIGSDQRWNRIVGCMVIYNAAEYLERAIRSLLTVADKIIVVDGPYVNYPHASARSDDGSLEILEKYRKAGAPITLVTNDSPWSDQIVKRNEYVNRCDVGDLLLILDGDCQVVVLDEAMKRLRLSDADGFQATDVKPLGDGRVVMIHWGNPYVIRKTEGMHYALNHYSIYDQNDRHVYLPPYRLEPLYTIFQVIHHGELRSPEKIADNNVYYSTRVEYADGHEDFVCGKCRHPVKLQHGERMLCPYCGHWELQADVKYDIPQ
jgi:glycosyltransferase involved in cell wall biosynthesis